MLDITSQRKQNTATVIQDEQQGILVQADQISNRYKYDK